MTPTQAAHTRSVEGRLAAYRATGAPRANLCASAIRTALCAPWQHRPSAALILAAVPEYALRRFDAPRGSIVYWTGGQSGHGHCCFALGDHIELSVDVKPGRPGEAGEVPFPWFGENWPNLKYAGWSWWWGDLDTRPSVLWPELPG